MPPILSCHLVDRFPAGISAVPPWYTFRDHPILKTNSSNAMRFEYYHPGLDQTPKLSVDGTVDNSIHFSHWQGNKTPAELKADTSTEIALNLVGSPNREQFTGGIDLVTNNHFDTDGVLSVWTVLNGERALELRDLLIPAAEAGDFSELSTDAGVKASIVIQGPDQPLPGDEDEQPPLASQLAQGPVDDARAYDLILPRVEHILTHIDDYESLWREPWERLTAALESFARGSSRVHEFANTGLSLVTLGADAFAPNGFDPKLHSMPSTAISKHAKGRLFLITTELDGGWVYRVDYPYYSWAETVVRPGITRPDFSPALAQLNEAEGSAGWQLDSSELASAIKFRDNDGKLAASRLAPDYVAGVLQTALPREATSAAG